jgi:hypothetical protein
MTARHPPMMPEPPPRRRRTITRKPWRTRGPASQVDITQLAERVMKARTLSICPQCKHPIGIGVLIGQVDGRWLHVRPCIIGGRAPMIGPSNEPDRTGQTDRG